MCDPEILRKKGEILSILSNKELNKKECWQYILDTYGYKTSVMSQYQDNGIAVFNPDAIQE